MGCVARLAVPSCAALFRERRLQGGKLRLTLARNDGMSRRQSGEICWHCRPAAAAGSQAQLRLCALRTQDLGGPGKRELGRTLPRIDDRLTSPAATPSSVSTASSFKEFHGNRRHLAAQMAQPEVSSPISTGNLQLLSAILLPQRDGDAEICNGTFWRVGAVAANSSGTIGDREVWCAAVEAS